MTVALRGTSLWSARQGWMASRQQPGSRWRELKSSGAEQRQKASSDVIHPIMVLEEKNTRHCTGHSCRSDPLISCHPVFSASPMIWGVSEVPWMEIHCSRMTTIHPQYPEHILYSSAQKRCTSDLWDPCLFDIFQGFRQTPLIKYYCLAQSVPKEAALLPPRYTLSSCGTTRECLVPHVWCVPIQETPVRNVAALPEWHT